MPSPLTFLKSLTNHKEPTTTPRKGILRRNPAKLKKSSIHPDRGHHPEPEKKATHISASNSPLDEHDEDDHDGIYEVPFHSSIPNGSVDGWRNFPPPHKVDSIMMKGGRPASQPRQSEALAENPIVSRYYTTSQAEHPPPKIPEPVPPSRTWSTIPSIQRESSHVRRATTAHASFAPSVARGQSTPFRPSGNSEDFSLLTKGQQPSEHERRLIGYPSTPSAKQANLPHPSNSASQQDKISSLRRANTVITQRGGGMSNRDETDSDPEVYHYIVPAGVDVIFQDDDGNEITRIGKTIGRTPVRNYPLKSAPIIVHDEFGTFLYQDTLPTGRRGNSRRQDRDYEEMPRTYSARDKERHGVETELPSWILSSPTSLSPRSKIIKIDRQGNQTSLTKSTNLSTYGGS